LTAFEAREDPFSEAVFLNHVVMSHMHGLDALPNIHKSAGIVKPFVRPVNDCTILDVTQADNPKAERRSRASRQREAVGN